MSTANSFYSSMDFNSRERLSLAPGSYGSTRQTGLKIVSYLGSKPDKTGAERHSFLVAATRPSREQLQSVADHKTNGKAAASGTPFDEPDYEGTAFWTVSLSDVRTSPEAIALARTEASRDKDGTIRKDYNAKAIEAGLVTEDSIQRCRVHFQKIATDKCVAANTPTEGLADAVKKQYLNELSAVEINIREFFLMQDWKFGEGKRDPGIDPADLVGTEFAGLIKSREFNGKVTSEVASVYSRKG